MLDKLERVQQRRLDLLDRRRTSSFIISLPRSMHCHQIVIESDQIMCDVMAFQSVCIRLYSEVVTAHSD